jgi:transaldolase/glucose-6-phosphate isomerase
MNSLLKLRAAGQSVWLDFLRRSLITGGSLERLVRADGVAGVTSNPSIFGKRGRRW